jgi:PAS domain S-box-containing protein
VGYENLSNEDLRIEIQRLTDERARFCTEAFDQARLLLEVQVHEVELEAQNRELRETQSELLESRRRYADLYDCAPIPYLTLSDTGILQEVNQAGAAMLGQDRVKLAGKPFIVLVKLSDPPVYWAHLRRCRETRAPVTVEMSFSTGTLGVRSFQVASTPMIDGAGKVTALRTSFTDVTERQTALRERHLRERFEALDAASMAMSQALAVLAGPAVFQIIVDRARLMTGAELAAIGIGTDPAQPFSLWIQSGVDEATAFGLGQPPRPIGLLGKVLRQGSTLNVPDVRLHPAFQGLPPRHPGMWSFLGVPIFFGERAMGNLYLANKRSAAGLAEKESFTGDDERIAEMLAERAGIAMELARLSDVLYSAVRTREDVLAMVAHDLRNPLWGIRLHAEAAKRAAAHGPAHLVVRAADAIHDAVALMDRLIGDLLQAAEIEAQTFSIEPASEAAAGIVDELASMMGPLAEAKSIRLEPTTPADLPAILCDRRRVYQVLANLVGNSLKFTPAGGTIRVEASSAGDGEVCFMVSDTGSGIPEEQLPHIFERHWKSKLGNQGGVGLGLFIAKGIVEAHGGKIWATSTVGAGSTFYFTITTVT